MSEPDERLILETPQLRIPAVSPASGPSCFTHRAAQKEIGAGRIGRAKCATESTLLKSQIGLI